MNPLKRKMVFVEWYDTAGFDNGWHTLGQVQDAATLAVYSLGWLVKDEKEYITIVSSMSLQDNPKCLGDSCIPRGCIKRIVKLKGPKK